MIVTEIYPSRIYDEIGHPSNSPKTFAASSSGFNGLLETALCVAVGLYYRRGRGAFAYLINQSHRAPLLAITEEWYCVEI
jgi:hypothetical protein